MYGVSNSNVGGFAADVASRHQRYQDARQAQTQQNILKQGNVLSQAGFKQLSGSAEKHAGFEESGFATLEGGGTFGTVKAVGKGLQKIAGKVREYQAGANRVAPEQGEAAQGSELEMDTTGVTRSGGSNLFNNPLDPDSTPTLGRQGGSLPADYDDAPVGNLGTDAPVGNLDTVTTDATGGLTDLGEAGLGTFLEGAGSLLEAASGPLGVLMGGYALYTGIKDLIEGGDKEKQGEDLDKQANAMVTSAPAQMENMTDKYVAPVSSAI
jgi:hypothetical protein